MEKDGKEQLKCQGCGGKGEEIHSCPYAEEINDNFQKICNCCDACRHECLMDI